MPTDLADTVEITHGILAGLDRLPKFVHVPTPKHRDDEAYCAPLAALPLPEILLSRRRRSRNNGTIATIGSRMRPTLSASKPAANHSTSRTFLEELDEAMVWAGGIFMGFVVTAGLLLHGQVVYSLVPLAIMLVVGYWGHKKYKGYRRPQALERRRWTDWAIVWGILGAFLFPFASMVVAGIFPPGIVSLASYGAALALIVVTMKRNRKEKSIIREIEVAAEKRRSQEAEKRRQAHARAESARQQIESRRRVEEEARKREAEARTRAENAERAAAAERERQARRAQMTNLPIEILDRVRAWDPDDVEHLVAALWDATPRFVRVRKTPKGPDAGIDVYAEWIDDTGKSTRIDIQVKRLKQPIGRRDIQLFRGSLPGGGRGTFLTTGTFNENARREAQRAEKHGGAIELVDGSEFARRLTAAGFWIGHESGEFDLR